jgi:iron complex transport system permease protein
MTAVSQKQRVWALPVLAAAVLGLALVSSSMGPVTEVRAPQVLQVVGHWVGLSGAPDPAQAMVVEYLRLPRVALAILAGAALGMAGAALQGLFRNPLADPALIGVSSGGAVGAVVVIVLGGTALRGLAGAVGAFALPVAAMAGGVVVTFLVYQLAKVEGRTHLSLMLLTGIAVNALAGAAIGMMVYVASDQQMREWLFWSLGSLTRAGWPQIGAAAVFAVPAMAALPALARPLNALLLGEAEAFHLGVPVQRVKRVLILLSAVMVGATVAVCGTIGFLGLVTPHLVRLALGPDHRVLLPASGLLGAALLLAADIAARLPAGGFEELPIGVITALVGAPVFLGLLLRARKKGEF